MALLERWLKQTSTISHVGRPLVTLSYAQSLDGSIASRRGQATAISGPESLKFTHALRAAHDAILVGIDTVLSDDPQLNARLAKGKDPQVVVLDSGLRLPLEAKLLNNKKKPWIFCIAEADVQGQKDLEAIGVRVERQTGISKWVDLPQMLTRLDELDIGSVMVEGGGRVIGSFLAAGLADRAMVTIAPVYLNGYKIPQQTSNKAAGAMPRMKDVQVEDAGKDMILFGCLDGAAP